MKLTKNVALTKQERLSTAAFFSLAVMRKFILYSKFLPFILHLVSIFQSYTPFSLLSPHQKLLVPFLGTKRRADLPPPLRYA